VTFCSRGLLSSSPAPLLGCDELYFVAVTAASPPEGPMVNSSFFFLPPFPTLVRRGISRQRAPPIERLFPPFPLLFPPLVHSASVSPPLAREWPGVTTRTFFFSHSGRRHARFRNREVWILGPLPFPSFLLLVYVASPLLFLRLDGSTSFAVSYGRVAFPLTSFPPLSTQHGAGTFLG